MVSNAERALGGLRSGTLIPIVGACFTNNTGTAITSLDVAYTGEQWRLGTAARTDQINFEYSTDATDLTTGTWTGVPALNFVTPNTATTGAKDGNAAGNRTALTTAITGLSIPNGADFWVRWADFDASGADDGLAVDDFSLTPQAPSGTALSIGDVASSEGNVGTTNFSFMVSLSAPAGPGGVTFDIATANGIAVAPGDYMAQSLTGQTIPAGSSTYAFNVVVNGDTSPESDETFFVDVTSVTGATVTDGQGQGTILNDELSRIHDVQGNGSASPLVGNGVLVEGVVIGDYQGAGQLQGFFLQEEDTDADADPATSQGIFVFCDGCPTPVAEGQRVRATGSVSEFFNMTQITASAAGSVVVTEAGNHLAEVTPATIDLPVAGDINTFYETREGMLVTFVDTLSVSEYFELFRFGQIELFEGGRPRQFTESAPPSVAGYAAHLDNLDRRRVILDDENNTPNAPLTLSDGSQFVYHPRANGGFSVGTQGVDFFRGGDHVTGLTGVLHWSFAGSGSADAWRIRPTSATPAAFTVANPRPATPPAVGGSIKAVSMNLLNYFTTIDTTASSSAGPCGPSATLDCRGADGVAELNRQRERASIAICSLNAHVYAFMELENTTASGAIDDLLGAVNARCGATNPYAFVSTGGTLGTDAIRVAMIYRTGLLAPVGSPLVDLDAVHNRPPTAQTFDVVDAANPAFGERFTVVANHFKSKGCPGTGADADAGDGQGCFNGTRTAQASRLLTWLSGTVVLAAGDPDLLLLGDFNSYSQEDPVTTLIGGGYTDLASVFASPGSYSYLFDGQLGHLDYAFASTSLAAQVTGTANWHINADEVPLFDYSDELLDSPGEAPFEEKPDGSALVPPRVVFQPASPYRASDHDPVIVGLFQIADLSVTNVDTPDPVSAGNNLTYTITVENAGPDPASTASWSDSLPAGTTFVSLASPGGWSCTTPAVGAGGTISCSIPAMPVGSAAFTLVVSIDPSIAAGTVLSNTATVASTSGDPDSSDTSATAATTVATSADLSLSNVDTPDPVAAGSNLTYTITVTNAGPSAAVSANWSDSLPAGTTFVSLAAPGGWSCTTPAVGAGGTVSCSIPTLPAGSAIFTLVVQVDPGVAAGTVLTNTATASSATSDPGPGNESGSATTTVIDTTAPTVTINQAAGQADPALSSPISFTVIFSEPVTGFGDSAADVIISGTAGATTATVSGSGTTYTVQISGMSGSGTVVASIPAGAAQDLATNPSTASTSTDNSVDFDPVVPVVTGIVRADPDPTSAASVQFTVTFSKNVTGVNASDFSLAAAGVSGAAITGVSGSGSAYTVTVSTGSGSGTLGLNLVDDDTIADTAGNPLGGSGPGNGTFSAGQSYTLDRTAPQADNLSVADITSTGDTSHTVTVVFSDNLAIDIASIDGGDIRVSGPGGFSQLAALVSVTPASNGTPRTATYLLDAPGGAWDAADNGTYTVTLQANQVSDTLGNAAAGVALGTFDVAIGAAQYTAFLPLVARTGTPDLVASLSLSPDKRAFVAGEPAVISVTVTNQGSAAAGPFWVDLYLSPSSPPTAANQVWNMLCGLVPCFGMTWQVPGGLAPGESITLSSQSLPAGYSIWPGWFAAGTSDLYVYADSYNPGVAAGAVAESDEGNNRAELHDLSVSGPNPQFVGVQGALRPRPQR